MNNNSVKQKEEEIVLRDKSLSLNMDFEHTRAWASHHVWRGV